MLTLYIPLDISWIYIKFLARFYNIKAGSRQGYIQLFFSPRRPKGTASYGLLHTVSKGTASYGLLHTVRSA